jgi:hypothetical protein
VLSFRPWSAPRRSRGRSRRRRSPEAATGIGSEAIDFPVAGLVAASIDDRRAAPRRLRVDAVVSGTALLTLAADDTQKPLTALS